MLVLLFWCGIYKNGHLCLWDFLNGCAECGAHIEAKYSCLYYEGGMIEIIIYSDGSLVNRFSKCDGTNTAYAFISIEEWFYAGRSIVNWCAKCATPPKRKLKVWYVVLSHNSLQTFRFHAIAQICFLRNIIILETKSIHWGTFFICWTIIVGYIYLCIGLSAGNIGMKEMWNLA